MRLKDRLLTAFFIMIALPIMLLSAAAGTIVSLQTNSIQESYDVNLNTVQVITNPIQILNRITRGIYNEIKLDALKEPEKLEDMEYINCLNDELSKKYSFIAIRKGSDFVYFGNEEKLQEVKKSLPEFGVYNTDVDGGMYVGGKSPFLVKAQDFYYSDGKEGTIFVITNLDTLFPQLKTLLRQSVASFVFVLILTAVLLMVWIYRSILRPLNILRIGMHQIKEGDLDYSVQSETRDEIGQLCDDFEGMRVRLKELIENRIQYEEDIKELISNISHDLKTPLTAIKGYAEGLMDGVADTPIKQEKYLQTILSKANDMSILVDELAFYAKIDCNTIPYTFKDISIRDYFDDCVEEISLDLEGKNIELRYDNELDENIRVIADAEQIKRVVTNIIGNAVKYLDKPRGEFRIWVHDIGKYVQIEIKDNGCGIKKSDIPYVFDRFYRADASRNTKKGGSGLGLAISKKIIEDHAGEIWAESDYGKGTTILFTLKKSENDVERTENISG